MKRYGSLVATCAAALCTATALSAQDATQDGEAYELDQILVSGGFTPIDEEKYGRSATVITAEEIEERGLTTVRDALRALPGVAVSEAGGNFTQVRIRGGESNHTLILIDGVEAAGGDGEYILSGLETTNIDRIEVLRGPQSVFYGSNASSGVINIITRSGTPGTQFSTSMGVDSNGGARISGFGSVRNERGGISLSLSENKDRGWDYSGDNGERDKIDRHTAIAKADYTFADVLTLGVNYRYSRENNDFDSSNFFAFDADSYIVDDPTAYSDAREQTFSAFADYEMLGGRLAHRVSYELTNNKNWYYGGPKTEAKTQQYQYRMSYGIDGTVDGANHLVSLLLEHEKDSSSSNSAYDRKINSVAGEYRGSFDFGLDLQAGVRYDDNDVFKDETTWNVGASYTFEGTGIRLHASAGEGVVNPTYFELYADAFGFVGNPNLSPEKNFSYDFGIEIPFHGDRGLIDVTYFRERLKDEIVTSFDGTALSFANESGKSKRHGVEVEGRYAVTSDIDMRLAYTWLKAKNPDGSREQRRPRHELGAGVTARTFDGRAEVSADVRYVADTIDAQYFPPYTPAKLPNYTVVDVAARYAVTDNVDATLRLENVFNKTYTDAWGYVGRDRTVYVGLDANW